MGTKIGIGITLDPEIWEKAKEEAVNANRTFSNYIETVLSQNSEKKITKDDLKAIAKEIHSLYNDKDFPEISDIQKILEKGILK